MKNDKIKLKLKIGCTGWGYQSWIGSFYPKNLDRTKRFPIEKNLPSNFLVFNSTCPG